uniref:NADH-ubiquinone oxidoreductase chain 3 n=2 Tax=unclassified Ceraphron TaxID=2625706 RepID=A0A096XKU5_9HYME|nr:NADH dehydrogenase subunit 3 [Ceraphron sp. MM-2014]
MMTMIIFLIFLNVLSMLLILMNWITKKNNNNNINKYNIFECGFQPFNSPRITFSLPYFMITLIFLIFDIEITLIFPFIISNNMIEMLYLNPLLLMFIMCLIWGLYIEWMNNALEWINL